MRLKYLLIILGAIFIIGPRIYAVRFHPELTENQLVREFIVPYVFGPILLLISLFMD